MNSPAQKLMCKNGRVVDLQRGQVIGELDIPIVLQPQAVEVLKVMAANSGQIVTTEELMKAASQGADLTDDGLMQCVIEIRQALGDEKHQILRMRTKRGFVLEASNFDVADDTHTTLPAKHRRGVWIAVPAGVSVLAVLAAYFWPVSDLESGRQLVEAKSPHEMVLGLADDRPETLISARAKADPTPIEPADSGVRTTGSIGQETYRHENEQIVDQLASKLKLAQREIERLKAEGNQTLEIGETLDRERQKASGLQSELSAALQSIDALTVAASLSTNAQIAMACPTREAHRIS